MAGYELFLILATLTVLSPGPGVVLTLSNALRHGWRGALPGIFGIASGAFIVAGICASSLGLLLAASATAFTVLKYIGALYLLYLGIKMWRTQRFIPELTATSPRPWRRFGEALSIQLLNPQGGVFFLAVFPQFIKPEGDYYRQFFPAGGVLWRACGPGAFRLCAHGQWRQGLALVEPGRQDCRQIVGHHLPGLWCVDGVCQQMMRSINAAPSAYSHPPTPPAPRCCL